ncbi:MAG: alpha/beta hydrolase [Hyphomicrobiales bacterium]|nr:alpha/beta hydrolase [Hyphomicrobiales bacterium]
MRCSAGARVFSRGAQGVGGRGRPVRSSRLFLMLFVVVTLVYGAAAGFMYIFQRDFLFRPSGTLTSPQENGLEAIGVERVAMRDGTQITVWRKAPANGNSPTVLYFHGNGGNLAGRAKCFQQIIDSGMGLYAPTYRGYAGAGGVPSETALIGDALEHFDRANGAGGDIVIHGESLGTGVAVAVAAKRDARALLLEAPYTGAVDVASAAYPWLPVSLLMKDPFVSRDKISDIEEPLLVIHGTKDTTIPFRQGQALYEMAGDPKQMVAYEGAGHSDLWARGLWPAAVEFLKRSAAPASAE